MSYDVHPDFKLLARIHPPINRVSVPLCQAMMRPLAWQERSDKTVRVRRLRIPRTDGTTISALLYEPAAASGTTPALAYYHGGGFVFPAAPYQYQLARLYAAQTGCRTLLIDYRLAPKHPFPAAPEDCFTAYRWLLDHADTLAIDPTRIAVGGDSAGGMLSIDVCLMARAQGLRMPCAQLLTYPACGGGATGSYRQFTDTPMCNSLDMDKYGQMYFAASTDWPPEYTSPATVGSMDGLPRAYIETAAFDALRDGAILYANRLAQSGVPVALHNTEGTVHGYDMALKSEVVQACICQRVAFLKAAFAE